MLLRRVQTVQHVMTTEAAAQGTGRQLVVSTLEEFLYA